MSQHSPRMSPIHMCLHLNLFQFASAGKWETERKRASAELRKRVSRGICEGHILVSVPPPQRREAVNTAQIYNWCCWWMSVKASVCLCQHCGSCSSGYSPGRWQRLQRSSWWFIWTEKTMWWLTWELRAQRSSCSFFTLPLFSLFVPVLDPLTRWAKNHLWPCCWDRITG